MSNVKITINQHALNKVVQDGVARMAAQQTADLEQLRLHYAGQPAEAIKPALQQLFAGYGGSITDPELSEWAQLISDNTRITMTPSGARFGGQ